MGQGQSAAPRARSHEELVKELANRFAEKCFTPLELYCLKDNFRSLADSTREQHRPSVSGADTNENETEGEGQGESVKVARPRVVRYLKEDTIARFLELPDAVGASPVVFQMISFLGAFPFLSEAPAVLGLEQLVIVVTLLTDRYRRVLARGAADRNTLLFRSLAVHDRRLFGGGEDVKVEGGATKTASTETETSQNPDAPSPPPPPPPSSTLGFAVDCALDDDDDDDNAHTTLDDLADDDLAAAALDAFDYVDPSSRAHPRRTPGQTLHGARIPADNFRRLLLLLLLVAPLDPQEHLAAHVAGRVTGTALATSLRAAAECLLATFLDVETSPGIAFAQFEAVLPVCFPHLFDGLGALFEHFLFSRRVGGAGTAAAADAATPPPPPPPPPLLLRDTTDDSDTILDLALLSQLSFFLPGASLFHRLRLLYAGGTDGFSLGSFETKVFHWRAPSLLLVRGTRLRGGRDAAPRGQEAAFAAALPPRRLPTGSRGSEEDDDDDDDSTLIFGAYLGQPWRLTHRECFGDTDAVLFQLSPVHDVFGASALRRDYAAFVKPTAANNHAGGIAFGCPPPRQGSASSSSATTPGVLPLGPLSLMIDANLEFGVFTHETGGGGSFHASTARAFAFQERFAVDALEVWGCGGDAEARAQAERWAWEAREAEARRRVNLGTGDVEADRALLEMAGLVGGSRSGGSMG